jgi:hypothetical protein
MRKPLSDIQREQQKIRSKEWYKQNKEKVRAQAKLRNRSPEGKARGVARKREQYQQDPTRRLAVNKACREWYYKNHERALAYAKTYRDTKVKPYPEIRNKNNATHQFKLYGLTKDTFTSLLEKQGNICPICHCDLLKLSSAGHRISHIDHNHQCCPGGPSVKTCGKCIRGILCNKCNQGLGLMNESPTQLRQAAEYLERWNNESNILVKPVSK